jgi:hypothetical protein
LKKRAAQSHLSMRMDSSLSCMDLLAFTARGNSAEYFP